MTLIEVVSLAFLRSGRRMIRSRVLIHNYQYLDFTARNPMIQAQDADFDLTSGAIEHQGHGGGERWYVAGSRLPDRRDIQVLVVMGQHTPHTRHASPIDTAMVFPEGP
jgi:hypothetical protein